MNLVTLPKGKRLDQASPDKDNINTAKNNFFMQYADFEKTGLINQKTGFMSHPTLTHTNKKTGKKETNNYLKREVGKAESRLSKVGISLTSGCIIAEQTFGF